MAAADPAKPSVSSVVKGGLSAHEQGQGAKTTPGSRNGEVFHIRLMPCGAFTALAGHQVREAARARSRWPRPGRNQANRLTVVGDAVGRDHLRAARRVGPQVPGQHHGSQQVATQDQPGGRPGGPPWPVVSPARARLRPAVGPAARRTRLTPRLPSGKRRRALRGLAAALGPPGRHPDTGQQPDRLDAVLPGDLLALLMAARG